MLEEFVMSLMLEDLSPVDISIGKRVKDRRTLVGMTQTELGNIIGVTFQQIQKYEKGMNRITASTLYKLAEILKVDIAYFYQDVKVSKDNKILLNDSEDNEYNIIDEVDDREILTLIRSYVGIKDINLRKRTLSLLKAMSGQE